MRAASLYLNLVCTFIGVSSFGWDVSGMEGVVAFGLGGCLPMYYEGCGKREGYPLRRPGSVLAPVAGKVGARDMGGVVLWDEMRDGLLR